MNASFVVTGAGRGIGRATVERLLKGGNFVVGIELDPQALAWADTHPAGDRIGVVAGDATTESVAERAADIAESAAPLTGWVNNAAVFRDASVHSTSAAEVLALIDAN